MALYASAGRPSIAPEYLLRAQLIQILYAIPSERRLVEQLQIQPPAALVCRTAPRSAALPRHQLHQEPRSPAHQRDRQAFFCAIRSQAEAHKLLSREHFSVDGTLLEAAAALKSLRPIEEDEGEEPPRGGGRNPDVDFHGQRRGNATHRSTTDPEARLARKGAGKEARLCYAGHSLIENRHGLITECELTQASRQRRARGRPAPAGQAARPPRAGA